LDIDHTILEILLGVIKSKILTQFLSSVTYVAPLFRIVAIYLKSKIRTFMVRSLQVLYQTWRNSGTWERDFKIEYK